MRESHRRVRPARWGLFPVLLLIASISAVRGADGEKPEAAVSALLKKQADDWNKKDLDGFLSFYWNDPGLVFQSGTTRTNGLDATRARYRARYQAEGKEMGKLTFDNVEVIVLAPDSVLVRGKWELTMSDGKKPGGLFTLIVRKLKDGWKIVHDHTSG